MRCFQGSMAADVRLLLELVHMPVWAEWMSDPYLCLRPLRQIHPTRTLRKRAYERSILSSFLTNISRAWQRTPRTVKRLARLHTPGALGPSHHRDLLSEPLLHLFPRHLTTPIQFLCTPRWHGPHILA